MEPQELVINPNSTGVFSLESAFSMLNHHVVNNADLLTTPNIESIGYVAGIIHLNEEVEVIVKFMSSLEMYTQSRFHHELTILNDEVSTND